MERRLLAVGWKHVEITTDADIEQCLSKICISVVKHENKIEAVCNLRILLKLLSKLERFVLYVKLP